MSLMKKAIGGSIHRIREFELEKVNLGDEFDILQIVGEGWFGKILLTEHRSTQTEMVLKALPKPYTSISDFYREFHYGLHLSAHRNIITTYDVAFETAGFFVFSQEYAPLGDLTSNVTETGLGELHAKRVARQLAAAIHHIHSRELVHRDVKLDNILVFKSDFSRIKLCDFGETRRVSTVVRRHNEWLPYSPPEVLQIDTDDAYKALTAHDVWQFGIVIFVCLTGCLPWQKAATDDPRYARYLNWHSATLNIAKKPKLFQLISSRAQRMFKRLLDPKQEKRPASVFEVNKYLDDRWLAKLGAEKALNGGADERDELCPSMYSFHSSLEEKNQLLFTLTQYGIETTVDRSRKKDRIREWIESSAIMEENEEESEGEDASDTEELNMRGKHFPERRESARSPEPVQPKAKRSNSKRNSIQQTKLPGYATPKPIERKNPFAPKVAKERQAIAKSASFPNGDPSLAVKLSGSDNFALPEVTDLHKPPAEIYSSSGIFDHYNGKIGHQNPTNSPQNGAENSRQSPAKVVAAQRNRTAAGESTNDNRSSPVDSKIGGRSGNNCVNGSPSSSTNVSRASPTASGVSQTVVNPTSIAMSPENGGQTLEAEGAPLESASYRSRSPQAPARKHRSQTATLPVLQPTAASPKSVQPRRSQTTVLPAIPSVAPLQPVNPLTMSIASQLVMQSFNSLQAMNIALPVIQPEDPQSVTSDGKAERQTVEQTTRTYGKDVYEHYGIAQGVVMKVISDAPRHRGSTGSGSRSVSN
ncbi:MAP/microtubule affinity-regulating kinase 4 [Neodiprion pinetum]|uniref:MAP/microtubule affinity-regulating kinase 4 n=1 Tax=Neodiprion pinetum TaxID=441929 RepID=UPI001EDEB4E8|nr:putative serine/threonine-protein kinase YPL150W [Neodiprion pinetum]